jgi:hypothetical protein
MSKLLMGVACLALATAPVAASARPFAQNDGGHSQRIDTSHNVRGGNGRGGDWRGNDSGRGGAALAAGIFGFFLATAIANSNNNHNQAYDQSNYGYAQNCEWRTQAYDVGYGRVEYRQVQVCD